MGKKENQAFIKKINASGYAGIIQSNGAIVDRRVFPEAIPMQEDPGFGIAKPKPVCRQCGCSEMDACIHPKRGNCSWAYVDENLTGKDLCSHCKNHPGEATRYSKLNWS